LDKEKGSLSRAFIFSTLHFKHGIYWRNPKFICEKEIFIMMSRGFKNFIIFNRKQNDSELAAGDIDSALMAGMPRLIGDHYMVVFNTGFSTRTDEEAYAEQLKNAKRILDKYKINYRICKFKD
jgi:hypothetical protein